MKKVFLAITMCAGLLWSCSDSETEPIINESKGVADGTIAFNISAKEDAVTSRAGRPLYSSEALQEVENMNIYVFLQSGSDWLYQETFDLSSSWNKGDVQHFYTVPMGDNLPVGEYKFVAVGRDLTDNYTIPTPTNINTFMASIASVGQASEIFVGTADGSITADRTGLRVEITTTRQVAGILGYFTNVPQKIGTNTVKRLKLFVSESSKSLNLSTGVGSVAGGQHTIMDINLVTQSVNNGVYSGNTVPATISKLPNSQLGGDYAIPVNNISMTIALYGDDTTTPLKQWTIKTKDGGNEVFSLVGNNFYTLGMKSENGSTDDDKGIDLMTDQEILVTINPAWGTIHELELAN